MKRKLIGIMTVAATAILLSTAPGCGGAGSASSTDPSEARRRSTAPSQLGRREKRLTP